VQAPSAPIEATPEDRVAGALWGVLIADALAMPAHWYYDGFCQVMTDYHGPIQGYVQPKYLLPGSIMNRSNTGGAGRGDFTGDIIGTVINHGKKKYWDPAEEYHYHCTLQKGENTLDAQLVRLVVQGICSKNGSFSSELLRTQYVKFMTTPGSHNDAYASTTHRMFFANRAKGVPVKECPDNDGKNVDVVDGLLMGIPVSLAYSAQSESLAHQKLKSCISVTRKSEKCYEYAVEFDAMLRGLIAGKALKPLLERAARPLRLVLERSTVGPDPISQ
jgi:ADP-ribosylglycohydrolase